VTVVFPFKNKITDTFTFSVSHQMCCVNPSGLTFPMKPLIFLDILKSTLCMCILIHADNRVMREREGEILQLNNQLKLAIKHHNAEGSCRFRWWYSVDSLLQATLLTVFSIVIWSFVIVKYRLCNPCYVDNDFRYILGVPRNDQVCQKQNSNSMVKHPADHQITLIIYTVNSERSRQQMASWKITGN